MDKPVKEEFEQIFMNHPQLDGCRDSILSAYQLLLSCYRNRGLIMTCGNGGSAADADHIVGELMKGFKLKRILTDKQKQLLISAFPEEGLALSENLQQAIPALSLTSQIALSTAFINDVTADMVYAQQVFGYGKPGDVLIGLSTSGNSRNVVNACKVAKAFGIHTIAMTGESESILSRLCDVTIRVPASETFRVQEYHLPVYHGICSMLEKNIRIE